MVNKISEFKLVHDYISSGYYAFNAECDDRYHFYYCYTEEEFVDYLNYQWRDLVPNIYFVCSREEFTYDESWAKRKDKTYWVITDIRGVEKLYDICEEQAVYTACCTDSILYKNR